MPAAALLVAAAAAGAPRTFEISDGCYTKYNQTCFDHFLATTAPANVKAWLRAGGRGIDTALCYFDQPYIADAIKEAVAELGISRDDIFVLTKVPGTWRALEDFHKAGKARAIGIERNPYFQQPGAIQFCKEHGIHCQ
eukprot:gene37826-24107_t